MDKSILQTYAIRTRDKSILYKSTSGGLFSLLAEYTFFYDGIICACSFDNENNIVHKFLSKDEYLKDKNHSIINSFCGSKYVQSDLGNSFRRIKKYLCDGKMVCFIGTPCQVNGLKSFLSDSYSNLLTVDLVCHGTPSPKLWNKYIEYQTAKFGSKITCVSFRSKKYGYHSGGYMFLRFANGKKYCASARIDYMLKSFFEEISSRPSCYNCNFKTLNRISDLSLYDCWHFDKLSKGLKDDDLGYTNVIVQSPQGEKVIHYIKNYSKIYNVSTLKAKKLDGIMIESCAVPHRKRNEFYKMLDTTDLPKHISKYIPISLFDILFEKVKNILYRVHILQVIKRILKK